MVSRSLMVRLVSLSIVMGLIGGTIAGRFTSPSSGTTLGPGQTIEERRFVEESDSIKAIEKVVPAVISIVATKDLQVFQQSGDPFAPFRNDPFFRQFGIPAPQQESEGESQPETRRQQVSGGTGFIVRADGLAVTNKHVVVDTEADYTALTNEGTEYDVEIISRDPLNDLAVIQLHVKKTDGSTESRSEEDKVFGDKPENLPAAVLGDSLTLQVGQHVLAIGNARGEYVNSVTSGIVSAIGRQIQASDKGGQFRETLSDLIQTDAAINFGNSGGPLVNLAGEVIGVNTAIDEGANGVGFAIPVSQIRPALASVEKLGRIVRPFLGVNHMLLDERGAEELKLEGVDHGALIVGDRSKKEFGVVPDSPAEKAGLKIDDVIIEVNGEEVTLKNTLQTIISKHAPGDKIHLKVWRDGKSIELEVELDELKPESLQPVE